MLADTSYATRRDLVALGGKGVEVDMPPPVRRTATAASVRSRERRLESEPVALRDWRARMASEEGQAVYRRRLSVEAVNGMVKGRELGAFPSAGLSRCTP